MLVRQVVFPASPERLWDALTEPGAVSAWFGGRVEWDLRPGGEAHFVDDDGTIRGGVIDAVHPARHLRFRWWPMADGPDGGEGADQDQGSGQGSQVSYDLEAEGEGTRLTVTEQPIAAHHGDSQRSAGRRDGDARSIRGADPGAGFTARSCPAADPGAGFTARSCAGADPGASAQVGSWTSWDSRLFRCWACAAAVVVPAGGTLR